jgi:hypothetical protein
MAGISTGPMAGKTVLVTAAGLAAMGAQVGIEDHRHPAPPCQAIQPRIKITPGLRRNRNVR